MVDEQELISMEIDGERDTPVVVGFVDIFGKWYISHAKSGQNAFRSTVNGFSTKEDATEFAEDHDCEVMNK